MVQKVPSLATCLFFRRTKARAEAGSPSTSVQAAKIKHSARSKEPRAKRTVTCSMLLFAFVQ